VSRQKCYELRLGRGPKSEAAQKHEGVCYTSHAVSKRGFVGDSFKFIVFVHLDTVISDYYRVVEGPL
jgi:hypothetical protein